MVPDTSLSIRDGAIAAWPGAWQGANLRSIVSGLGIDVDIPWAKLRKKDRDWLLFTDEQPQVLVQPEPGRIDHGYYGKFWSARAHVHHVLATSKSQMMRDRTMRFVRSVECVACRGTGLQGASLAVTFRAQRLRIATQLRSGLFGVVYVLDEPSAGLHPADAEPLLDVLDRLKGSGNSLFVVEHDLDVLRRADWVVDIGSGAGEGGGHVLDSGPVAGLEPVEGSITGDHLFGRTEPLEHHERTPQGWLHLRGVTRHNLGDVCVDVPLCVLTAVTGVSGSGKSTLVSQVLAELVRDHLGQVPDDDEARLEVDVDAATGLEAFDRLVRGWTSVRSGAPRAPTWRPTPACSTRCASSSPGPTRRGTVATRRAGSRSTLPRDAARPARGDLRFVNGRSPGVSPWRARSCRSGWGS